MSESGLSINKVGRRIEVSGNLAPEDQLQWDALKFGSNRIMLVGEGDASEENLRCSSFANIEVFVDSLVGLYEREWSGEVHVYTDMGTQKIFFNNGSIVFATTNLMDNRLGEIIYRKKMISLDKLTECTAAVTRNRKFGQVLLEDNYFTNLDLWDALKNQVREIIRCICMSNRLCYEIVACGCSAPTELTFEEGTDQLIADCSAEGALLRSFVEKLLPESTLRFTDEGILSKVQEGTFDHDILKVVEENRTFAGILSASKSHNLITLSAILRFVNRGILVAEPLVNATAKLQLTSSKFDLKSKIDSYSLIMSEVRNAFYSHSLKLPVDEMRSLLARWSVDGIPAVRLDDNGDMAPDSVERLYVQANSSTLKLQRFVKALTALIQFVVQVGADNLPVDIGRELRSHYRRYVSL